MTTRPVWQLGFRPFYLLASAFAALSVALWGAQSAGWLPLPYLRGPAWHAHEMLFGFTLAVVVGFLFTAGRNWSGQPTPIGGALMALAGLWLAARLLVLTPWLWASAAANLAFAWGSAYGLARALHAGANRRNYFFVALLTGLGLASLAVHLAQAGLLPADARLGLALGLDIVLFVMAVMAGRVTPMFTNNGVPGANARRHPHVERVALGSVLALVAADLSPLERMAPNAMIALLAVAAVAHGVRLALWQPWRTLHTPLVWVLHAAYAWIVLHLGLRALAVAGFVAPSLATHALTAGAIGSLVIGMMTRTARGHTGRPLRAEGAEVAMYLLVLLAGGVRVGLPLLRPDWALHAIGCSALLWAAGFGLYALRYGPWLMQPRVDGKPG